MAALSGKVGTGPGGHRVPVRIEDPESGELLASAVTDPDGYWTAYGVPVGRVTIAVRGLDRFEVDVPGDAAAAAAPPAGWVGARHARRVAALRGEG